MTSSAPTMLAVLDFEATCADATDVGWDSSKQEIIEFPVALISVAERAVVDTFSTFVRPSQQPLLTPFCTKLTTIRQADVDAAPEIGEVLARFEAWLASHAANESNTCVVTCGDWDLRRMWPLQASIGPGLRTPPIFRSWTNIKTTFRTHTGVPASGMMSMLNHLSLDHEGVHHRGIDDVRNLCRLTNRLLNEGAAVAATWSNAERAAERVIHEKKLNEALGRLEEKALARSRLPATVPEAVRAVFESGEAKLANEVERLRRLVGVFSDVL